MAVCVLGHAEQQILVLLDSSTAAPVLLSRHSDLLFMQVLVVWAAMQLAFTVLPRACCML
jgi:hypothetical protein